jgi:hypothetical protein
MNNTGLFSNEAEAIGFGLALGWSVIAIFLVVWPIVRMAVTFVDYLRAVAIRFGWWCWFRCFDPVRIIIGWFCEVFEPVLSYIRGGFQDLIWSVEPVKAINFISNGEFVYESGKPCIRIVLDGVAQFVDLNPFLALHMSQRVGPESAIAGSMFMDVKEQPAGSFSLWNNEMFVGCANRIIVNGRKYIVTAKHVYDALVKDCVYAQYKHRRAPIVLQPLVLPEGMDFVVCKDNQIIHFWGVKAQKTVNFSDTKVYVAGSPDGVNWKQAQGECKAGRPFTFTHTASTMPGYSGMLVRDAAGRALGLHTGSVKKAGVVVNEGIAIVDFLNALLKHSACRTMESYEEYDKPQWDEDDDHSRYIDEADEISFDYEGKHYNMHAGTNSYTFANWVSKTGKNWADYSDDEEEYEEEEHFEEKADSDFQIGLVTSATPVSAPSASQSSSNEATTLSKSQRKNRARRLRKKATVCSRTLEKATAPSASATCGTAPSPTNTSQRPATLSGPTDPGQACSNPSLTTAPCSNKNESSPLPATATALLRKLSQKFNQRGRVTMEQKMLYMVTRQHEPTRPLSPQQQADLVELRKFQTDFPTHFEQAYRETRNSARSHAKSS